MKQKEKVLTRELVEKLGLDKVKVITSDMLDRYTSIGHYAFSDCKLLTSITLPNSIMEIGIGAFKECSSLTYINIPNSVTRIGTLAFYNVPNIMYSGTETGSPWFARSVNGYVEGYLVYVDETKTSLLACSTSANGNIIIPNSVTSIGYLAFDNCSSITSITIPNSIKYIENYAFRYCNKLKNVVIGDNVYKKHKVVMNKCKAYKAFNANLTCRDFQYEEGKTYKIDGEPELCNIGFHACLSLTDVFNYYYGDLGKEIVVYEVELEGISDEKHEFDSKIVAKKIKIGKRIL